MDNPPKKWFRMGIGKEVRLKYAYYITVTEVIRNASGEPIEILCTYDPESRGGDSPDARKVKGTIHWLSRNHAVDAAEIRLYDHLITLENPSEAEEGSDLSDYINPDSETILQTAKIEPAAALARPEECFQFLRNGYFVADMFDHIPTKHPVFNRVTGLRDTWAKIAAQPR